MGKLSLSRWLFLLLYAAGVRASDPLSSARQVKRLSVEEASARQPVVLRGVVTQVIPEWWSFSLQDATDGVYVSSWASLPPDLQVGQSVLVRGETEPANFAPTVRAVSIEILGPGRMPAARPATWQNLATGSCDNNYVEIQGVVRSAGPIAPPRWEWPATALRLDISGNLVWAYVRSGVPFPADALVDAAVLVRGVCLVFSNSQRQFQGLALSVSRGADVVVLQPALHDPFEAPARAISRLFAFQEDAISVHRVKVRGIATLQLARGIYVQDGGAGILVRASPPPSIRPGDVIEAVGFPTTGGFSTVLEDALVRVTGHAAEPVPRDVLADKMLVRVLNAPAVPNAVLVRVAGVILDRSRSAHDETLILTEGGTTFNVRLVGSTGLTSANVGSRVAITGVCTVQADDRGLPQSFELLMRSPLDLQVLQRAPWISRGVALRAAGASLAFLLIAVVALGILRKRVAKQTETIRRQFEHAVSLEQRYSELVENASDLVYVRELNGRLLQVNHGATEMTGYTRDELLAMNIFDLLAPEERDRAREELSSQSAASKPDTSSEWRFRTKDGRELIVETKQRFLIDNGKPALVECIGRDITARYHAQKEVLSERNRLQEQLHHSQKLDSIGRLAGGVAHDFNNLLTVIAGYAQMILEQIPGRDSLREPLTEIAQAADRAAGLTRQLLLFSRREKTTPSVISLNELLANFDRMIRRLIGEDINLTLSLKAATGRILADRGHMEQVVMNLVVNARDAMPDGGKLLIRTRDLHADEAYVSRYLDVETGKYVVLEVTDTGSGMSAEVRERIFEPFFTTKEQGKGTGLGLSTVYGIVKQAGGVIRVNSEPGRGSTFEVLLPAAASTDAAEVEEPSVLQQFSGAETILVAEDEPGVRNFIRDVLRSNGYTVLEAFNGRQALDLAAKYTGRIHLLLTDTVMPEMGGGPLAERFAQLRPGVPILHMSGYEDRPLGFAPKELLEKPFTPSALLQRIRQRLNQADGGFPISTRR